MWKKIGLLFLALCYSLSLGTLKFLIGSHTLSQVAFGWMLGIWIACSYFFILRDRVHAHIDDITNGRLNSSRKVHFLIASAISLTILITGLVTFLAVRKKDI